MTESSLIKHTAELAALNGIENPPVAAGDLGNAGQLAALLDYVNPKLKKAGITVTQRTVIREDCRTMLTVLSNKTGETIIADEAPICNGDCSVGEYGVAIILARRHGLATVCGITCPEDHGETDLPAWIATRRHPADLVYFEAAQLMIQDNLKTSAEFKEWWFSPTQTRNRNAHLIQTELDQLIAQAAMQYDIPKEVK